MVRKAAAAVLVAIGVFGIALAVLLPAYVVPHSKKTPLDLDITIHSTGSAQVLNSATGEVETKQLRGTRFVATDSQASDSKVTTVNERVCVVVVEGDTPDCVSADTGRLLSDTRDRVTTDRKTAEAVNIAKYGENVDGDTSVRHQGMAYKWPIDAKKQTYQFFQPDLKAAFPAVYKGESKIDGLTVYIYECAIAAQPYKVQQTFPGTYEDTRTVYVEPKTGAIIKGVEHLVQKLDNGDTALDTTLTFDQKSIDFQANYAKDKINALKVAGVWAPIGTGLVGLICLVGGILLGRGGPSGGSRRAEDPSAEDLDLVSPDA